MVNKLELNNELISLRKEFGKAKSRTINKLSRKLKSIEHGKAKDPKNAKLDGKATKLLEELKLLKDATKLNTVKQVYLFDKDPDKALKLQKATAEERAVCRLLMNTFLKDAIAGSKVKLAITDQDEEWKKLLFEQGKNKTKKLRKEKFEAAAGIAPTTALEKKIAKKKAKNKEKKAAKKEKLTSLDDKSKSIDKVARKEKIEQKTKLLKPKEDGGSRAVPKAKPAAVDNSPPKKVNLFPVQATQDKVRPTKKFDSDLRDSKKWNDDRAPRNNTFASKPINSLAPPAEKLHPSWEAKKQKKAAISEFKGKKTTFDD